MFFRIGETEESFLSAWEWWRRIGWVSARSAKWVSDFFRGFSKPNNVIVIPIIRDGTVGKLESPFTRTGISVPHNRLSFAWRTHWKCTSDAFVWIMSGMDGWNNFQTVLDDFKLGCVSESLVRVFSKRFLVTIKGLCVWKMFRVFETYTKLLLKDFVCKNICTL